MFAPQVKAMHGIPFEEGELRRCGRGWRIDPAWGEGTYWYYSMNSTAAFAVFDLEFHRKTDMSMHCADMLCFGSYGRGMIPYFTAFSKVDDGVETGTLLGYIWHDSFYRNIVQPGSPLAVTSLALTPEGATQMAARIGRGPAHAGLGHRGAGRHAPQPRAVAPVRRGAPHVPRRAGGAGVLRQQGRGGVRARGGLVELAAAERAARASAPPTARRSTSRAPTRASIWAGPFRWRICARCRWREAPASSPGCSRISRTTTPMGWVRDRRMERACQLLVQTDDSLAAVSAAVGIRAPGKLLGGVQGPLRA